MPAVPRKKWAPRVLFAYIKNIYVGRKCVCDQIEKEFLSHQLGASDHYCYDMTSENCNNPTEDCWRCDNELEFEPECVMSNQIPKFIEKLMNDDVNNMYCNQCLSSTHEKGILKHLINHHYK